MYATENLSTFIDSIHIERMLLLVLPLVLELNISKSYTAARIKYWGSYAFHKCIQWTVLLFHMDAILFRIIQLLMAVTPNNRTTPNKQVGPRPPLSRLGSRLYNTSMYKGRTIAKTPIASTNTSPWSDKVRSWYGWATCDGLYPMSIKFCNLEVFFCTKR